MNNPQNNDPNMICSCQPNNQPIGNPQFDKWHGVDRSSIDWQPEINESKCIGCGLCAATCGRKVYKFDYENKKSKVVNPKNCMVACQTCANLCPVGAIAFSKGETTREKAQAIVKENKILPRVKDELETKKEELKFNPL